MKILYLITEYTGGMRPYALSILKTIWTKDSYAIIVIRDNKLKLDFECFESDNIYFINYPESKLSRVFFRIYPQKLIKLINKIIKNKHIDLIHTLTGELILSSYFPILQRKIKILHSVHDVVFHDAKFKSIFEWLNSTFFLKIPNLAIISQAKYTITNSNSQLNELNNRYPQNNHSYSNFPTLITEQIINGNKQVPELDGIKNYILFFGRVEFYKGIHHLYDAYVSEPKLSNYKLVIAGTGNQYFLKEKTNNNVIIISRFIDDEEIRNLFENAVLVIYPYISATQSGVLSLASYFGKKIIVSDIPYFNELVRKDTLGVRIVDVSNKKLLIDQINNLIDLQEDSLDLYKMLYKKASLKKEITTIQNRIFQ